MPTATAKSLADAALCEMLLQQSPACAWLLKPDQTFEALYGHAPRLFSRTAAQLRTVAFADLFPPPARPAWTARLARVFKGETVSATGRFSPEGSPYSITLFPVRRPGAGIAFAGGLAHSMADQDMVLRAFETLDAVRAQISRLLHDHVGPYLSAAGLQLDLLRMDLAENGSPGSARASEVQTMLETIIGLLRDFGQELNPAQAERLGLRAALDQLAGSLRPRFQGNLRVRADAGAAPPPEASAALYRIAREAARNAVQHAGCSAIQILLKSLRRGPALEVRDNGQGFDPADSALARKGMGFLVMQHYADRAGIELHIDSAPGKGTVVRALYPHDDSAAA